MRLEGLYRKDVPEISPEALREAIINACRRVLADASRDPAFAAEALSLPGAAYIAEQLEEVDPEAILAARMGLTTASQVSRREDGAMTSFQQT
jgi:aminopeptidase N